MKLIIMTKPTFFVEEDKILTTLFEEGLDCLHLYKPGSEPIYAERLLTLLPEDCYKRIVVHDHFYLRGEYGLRGIHLNHAADLPPAGYRGQTSRTCHRLSEVAAARKQSDYVFLASIFESPGHQMASVPADDSVFGFEQLQQARRQGIIDRRVYALGGITLDNVRLCKDLGFGGVVVCGDLWNRFDIHRELDYKELIAHFRKLRKAVS